MDHIFLDFFQSLYPTYFTQYNQSLLFKEMRLCGWTPTLQQSQPQPQKLYIHTQPQTYSQQGNIKISVKMPDTGPQQQQKIQIRFNQQSPLIKPLNQTLPTSTINTSNWDQQQFSHSVQPSPVRQRKNSIIDCVSDDTMFKSSYIGGDQHARTSFSRDHAQYGMFRSYHTRDKQLKDNPKPPQPPFQSPIQPLQNSSTPQPSYSQLLKQNMELKKIINEEYIPLKSVYAKLKQEQQDREYLVSKLQWKVKQLAKEIKNKQF